MKPLAILQERLGVQIVHTWVRYKLKNHKVHTQLQMCGIITLS
ncbi:hypothetical protein LINPERPRIM_LOCUS24982 [Linum perenne]